jgi:feruloyl esterase
MKRLSLALLALGAGQTAFAQSASGPSSCERLADLNLPDTRITFAESIAPSPDWRLPDSLFTRFPGFGPPAVQVPFCRVAAVIETEINVEVWLPHNWNDRFQGVGNGGLSGALNYPSMAGAVANGYATASTDTGHVTDRDFFQADWIAGHPQRVVDFGHRAHHLMAERAKQIVAAFYGRPARRAYYTGCSSGGWQGLTEAQKYPDDYDDILAGAPAINYVGIDTRAMWMRQLAAKEPEGALDARASALLMTAAVAKCDALGRSHSTAVSAPATGALQR